jgi:hypothetical protein
MADIRLLFATKTKPVFFMLWRIDLGVFCHLSNLMMVRITPAANQRLSFETARIPVHFVDEKRLHSSNSNLSCPFRLLLRSWRTIDRGFERLIGLFLLVDG